MSNEDPGVYDEEAEGVWKRDEERNMKKKEGYSMGRWKGKKRKRKIRERKDEEKSD